jgi:hypothetical protein
MRRPGRHEAADAAMVEIPEQLATKVENLSAQPGVNTCKAGQVGYNVIRIDTLLAPMRGVVILPPAIGLAGRWFFFHRGERACRAMPC